ncbi:hypothetical protein F2Q70_00015301 [Brassica cretica]|uniref:Uncharacterized protein n=1 Tax=Brassica cretica TaxID=69181 RepID=A0A8S9I159_BRACR|nr:hypothetical protein F2Q70_00015301 [Brassica cretica]
MALQYISHSDPTERQARITRVQQSLQPGFGDSDDRAPLISHDINKGKGHVFNFQDQDRPVKRAALTGERPGFLGTAMRFGNECVGLPVVNQEASSSSSLGPTVFRVGDCSGTHSARDTEGMKSSCRRPQRWKRTCNQKLNVQVQPVGNKLWEMTR